MGFFQKADQEQLYKMRLTLNREEKKNTQKGGVFVYFIYIYFFEKENGSNDLHTRAEKEMTKKNLRMLKTKYTERGVGPQSPLPHSLCLFCIFSPQTPKTNFVLFPSF